MDLTKIIAVSGLPGLYKMAANRSNGLIIEDFDSGKKKFVSSRKHQFTPLESISIYNTVTDSTLLTDVFKSMLEKLESNPPVSHKGSTEEIQEYFAVILPEFDREKVFTSDIKKIIKWFKFLNTRDMLNTTEEAEAETTEETPEEEA